jgi:hypothetical protein
MKKSEIVVGGLYIAKVSNKLVTVRVDSIDVSTAWHEDKERTFYRITNLATGRKTTFRSAAKFRASWSCPDPASRRPDTQVQ